MDEEGFWVYGAPDGTFGAPNMVSGDMRLTFSANATAGSHFCPSPGHVMDYGGGYADIAISGWIMRHTFFDGAAPCNCVSYGCLAAAPPGHLDAMGGRVCC